MTCRVELHIWRLTPAPEALAATAELLSPDERDRAAAFVRPADRARFTLARAGLHTRLARYLGRTPGDLAFGAVGRKKPVIADGPAFNLSHSGGLAPLAVAPEHGEPDLPLGIDIEAHRAIAARVADLSFSAAERATLQRVPVQGRARVFFCGWTRKEAVLQALGTGLAVRLDSFDVAIAPDAAPRLLRASPEMPPPDNCALRHIRLSADMPVALAAITRGSPLKVHVRETPRNLSAAFRF